MGTFGGLGSTLSNLSSPGGGLFGLLGFLLLAFFLLALLTLFALGLGLLLLFFANLLCGGPTLSFQFVGNLSGFHSRRKENSEQSVNDASRLLVVLATKEHACLFLPSHRCYHRTEIDSLSFLGSGTATRVGWAKSRNLLTPWATRVNIHKLRTAARSNSKDRRQAATATHELTGIDVEANAFKLSTSARAVHCGD